MSTRIQLRGGGGRKFLYSPPKVKVMFSQVSVHSQWLRLVSGASREWYPSHVCSLGEQESGQSFPLKDWAGDAMGGAPFAVVQEDFHVYVYLAWKEY